ncbi:MAG: DUF4342 domain-containing protein, partial [Oscillospiraceae bacterium]|nr:DUF4342 domain-containing protein [Oscillospiraceae bacterium]
IVLLEQQGKVRDSAYSTKREAPPKSEGKEKKKKEKKQESSDTFDRFIAWVGRMVHRGNTNSLHVMQHGEKKLSLPITAVVLLLVFLFYFTVPLLIISLFFGFHYKFVGPDLGRDNINDAMKKASDAAQSIKEDLEKKVKEAAEKEKDEDDADEKDEDDE